MFRLLPHPHFVRVSALRACFVSYPATWSVIVGSLEALRLRLRTALCLCGRVLSALRLTASALHRTRGTTSVVGTGSAVRPLTLSSAQGLGTTDPMIAPPSTV